MRRGLKPESSAVSPAQSMVPRARPPMRRGLKPPNAVLTTGASGTAARAAPYEKGTETQIVVGSNTYSYTRRARGPL